MVSRGFKQGLKITGYIRDFKQRLKITDHNLEKTAKLITHFATNNKSS